MKSISFLTLAEVIEIHKDQIENYGGNPGIRDINLLSSAIAMAESSYNGEYLHKDIYEMASAYAFHICQNHPFIDGNKRAALVAALVFLDFNGIEVLDPKELLYDSMMEIAQGKGNKESFAKLLKKISSQR